MANDLIIRDATEADLERITEIYNTTIVESHVSFDLEPYDAESRRSWWSQRDPTLPCLVAESDGAVVGVSYAGPYRPKGGYRSSVETTIVLDSDHRGLGIGSRLLSALLARLETTEAHRAIAIIALPNEASIALHRRLGFREVGTLTEVGHKLGSYWDTMLLERDLDANSGAQA